MKNTWYVNFCLTVMMVASLIPAAFTIYLGYMLFEYRGTIASVRSELSQIFGSQTGSNQYRNPGLSEESQKYLDENRAMFDTMDKQMREEEEKKKGK